VSELWIKICGVTSLASALAAAESGADAIGLNFAPGSPRQVRLEQALAIVRGVGRPLGGSGRPLEWVGVFVDAPLDELVRARETLDLDWLQLHGEESPERLAEVAERVRGRALKALSVASAEDVSLARRYGGRRLLVDSKVAGVRGGTGKTFDWSLLGELPRERELVLAGGLRPDNVASAVAAVRPFGVDTASGVESAPGVKDAGLVRCFCAAARAAAATAPSAPRPAEGSPSGSGA
jgi:phosphoribosylanthranilate isomerase